MKIAELTFIDTYLYELWGFLVFGTESTTEERVYELVLDGMGCILLEPGSHSGKAKHVGEEIQLTDLDQLCRVVVADLH